MPSSRNSHSIRRHRRAGAFTLIELLVTLTIMSVLVIATVPYARRSHEAREVTDTCRTLVEMIRFAQYLAVRTHSRTALVIEAETFACSVSAAGSAAQQMHADLLRQRHVPAADIRLEPVEGFEAAGDRYRLCFDPARPWPHAVLTIVGKDTREIIEVTGEVVREREGRVNGEL